MDASPELKTLIKNLDSYNHQYEIRKFLLYLANNANPKRFFPFPSFLRDADPQKINNQIVFETYSDTEFDRVKQLLSQVTDDFIKNLPDIHTMKEKPDEPPLLKFARYLFDGKINISFHGENDIFIKYQFCYSTSKERIFNFQHKKRWLLFHGSSLGNFHSILRNGIKSMSGTKFMTTGQAYGPGIYATTDINTALMYGSCVMIIELIVDPEIYKKAHKIYVISNDDVVTPRYLLQFKKNSRHIAETGTSSSDEILAEHKREIENSISINTKNIEKYNARIQADLKALIKMIPETYCLEEIKDVKSGSICNVLHENILFEIFFEDYPFRSPIIKLGQNNDADLMGNAKLEQIKKRVNVHGIIEYSSFEKWLPTNNLVSIFLEIVM